MVNQWKRGWDIHEVNRGYNRYVYVKGGKANAINIAFFGMIVTDSYFVRGIPPKMAPTQSDDDNDACEDDERRMMMKKKMKMMNLSIYLYIL